MDEFRVPLPIIELKEEATEIVDLESSAKIPEEVALDWDHKVRLELNKNVPPIDSNSFFNCMEWYKRELKEITGSFADNDILKKCMMRHLKFFETIMRKCFHLDVNRYLDNAEDLLTSYANLIINDLMEKKNSLNRHELKKISAAESRRLKSLLLRCLLEKQDRVAHVLMRIDSYPNIRPCRDVLNNLFTHFITYLHHTPTDLNYIRCFIICQKWMQNRRPQEWELLERYVRDIFKKKPDSISKNQLLRNILIEVRPMMSGRLEMANYLYDKVKFMSNEYFNIVKNQERVEVMEIEDDTAECFPVWGERGDSDFDEEDYRKWMKELENSVKTFVNEVTIPDIKIESPEDCVILEAPKKFPAPIINRPPLQSNLIVGTKIEIPDEPIPQPPTVLEIKKPPDDLSEIAEKLPEVIPEEPPTICEENVLPETVEKENNVIEPPSVGERLQSNLIVGTKIEIPDEPIPQPPTVLEIKKPPDAGNTIDLSEIAEKLPEVIPEEPPTICEQPMVENVLPETVEKENNVIEPPSAGERQTTEEIVAPIREETIEKVPETTESLNVEEKTTEENTVTKEVTTVEVTVEKTVEEQSTSKTTRNRKFYDDSFERFLYGTIKTSETEKVATVETLSESWLMEQQITSTSVESEKATEKHDETTTEETVKKPDDSVFMTPPPSERFAENSEQTEKQENKTKTPTINNFDSFEREVDGLLSGPMTRSQTDVVNPDDNFDLFGDNDEERRHCESDSDIESPSYEPITELIEPRKIEPLIVKIPKNGRKPVIKRKKDKTRNKRGRKKENKDRKSEPEQPIIEEPVKRLRGRSKSAVIDEPPIVEEETSPISNGLPVTADAPMPHKGILKDPEKPKKKKQPLQFAPDVKSAEEENKVKARQRPLNSRRPEKQMICVNYDERLLQSETRWKPLPGEIAPAPVPSPPKGIKRSYNASVTRLQPGTTNGKSYVDASAPTDPPKPKRRAAAGPKTREVSRPAETEEPVEETGPLSTTRSGRHLRTPRQDYARLMGAREKRNGAPEEPRRR